MVMTAAMPLTFRGHDRDFAAVMTAAKLWSCSMCSRQYATVAHATVDC